MKGREIVLTSDRTLMSEYNDSPIFGFASCMPTEGYPKRFFLKYIIPSNPVLPDGSVKYANLALRKVEGCLSENGFNACVGHPDFLDKVVGQNTKIVGLTTVDPCGLAPGSTTATFLTFHETPFTEYLFKKVTDNVKKLKEKYGFKVIAGGPGLWQLKGKEREFGIDYSFDGEVEETLPGVVKDIISKGKYKESHIMGKPAKPEKIACIKNAANNGTVEISRGCGRGCKFCVTTLSGNVRSIPEENIIKDVKTNLSQGRKNVTIQSEDFLNYRQKKGFYPNEDAVYSLFKRIYDVQGVKSIRTIHANLSSAGAAPDLIEKLGKLYKSKGNKGFYFVQPGIETGSRRLMDKVMPGKKYPFNDWHEAIKEGVKVLHKNNFFSCATLIIGFPGETKEDIKETISVVKSISEYNIIYAPLLFVPITETALGKSKTYLNKAVTKENWELLKEVWKHNIQIIKKNNLTKNWLKNKFIKYAAKLSYTDCIRIADSKMNNKEFKLSFSASSLLWFLNRFDFLF